LIFKDHAAASPLRPGTQNTFRVITPLEKDFVGLMVLDMRQTLTFLPSDSTEAESDPAFKVLIAYEDFETGKHAKKTYDFLHENLGREYNLTNQMWKFDVLSIPKLREIAVKDAVAADIIIISSHGDELPEHLTKWIECWLMQGSGALVLVALFDRAEDSIGGPLATRAYLADVAKRGRMEFFAQPDEWPGRSRVNQPFSFQRESPMNEGTLSTLAGAVHRDAPIRHWGINE
jgi:hypothetical protein